MVDDIVNKILEVVKKGAIKKSSSAKCDSYKSVHNGIEFEVWRSQGGQFATYQAIFRKCDENGLAIQSVTCGIDPRLLKQIWDELHQQADALNAVAEQKVRTDYINTFLGIKE